LDSTDTAASATVLQYTANPTTGTPVGTISQDKAAITTTTGAPQFYFEDFGLRGGVREIVLRGTAQVLAVNLNAASIAGIACDAEVEWTEE
jgi:putative NADPH-quinone reductase